MIPYGRQTVAEEDIDAVVRVLRSERLTQGPEVDGFEHAIAQYCGAGQAVAVSSGTAALHIACLALGLGPGDVGWTVPNTFVASANCIRYCGAEVDFVDIRPEDGNIDPDALAEKLVRAEREGRLPRVLIPVHFGGEPCDLERIASLAERFGFKVIEDACHAFGGRFRDEPIGSGRFSDITVFSFHPIKTIATGEGGAAATNDSRLAARMRGLRTHGITRDPAEMEGEVDGPWHYQQQSLGWNYRLSDIHAALGRSQLKRADAFVCARRDLAARYDRLLGGLEVGVVPRERSPDSACHLYVVSVPGGPARRRAVFERMLAEGIGVNVHYIPVHLQPYYRRLGFGDGDFPGAEGHYRAALTLPLFVSLTEPEQDRVVRALATALSTSGRANKG